MPRYYQLYGRVFEVFPAPNADQANAMMAADESLALLTVRPSGECLMVAKNSRGVAACEVPVKLREFVEID